MKKTGLLNQPLSNVIAGLGHLDMLTVADAGLPIPLSTERIDLALIHGVPAFIETVQAILGEMQIERAIVAQEMLERSPEIYRQLSALLGNVPIENIPHVEFKNLTQSARAVVRTGEFTPYANVILVAGVVF